MLFSTYHFCFIFLPIALVMFKILNRMRFKWAIVWLNCCSLAFYGYWKVELLPLLLGTIVFNYLLSTKLGPDKMKSKEWLTLGVVLNLALLAFFKYTNFFLQNFGAVVGFEVFTFNVILPLGISFFTFQQISYIVDMHRERLERPPFFKYLLCITFFPHLIAGPLLHFKDILPQVNKKLTKPELEEMTRVGLAMFCIGLFKKLVLADPIGLVADNAFNSVAAGNSIGASFAIAGIFAYTLQIYLDFSGYSEMAIGMGKLFGITLPANFDRPYLSSNIIEFWRRWHMTLSRFLRDYLYILFLGGNRSGAGRRNLNLMITMLLGGLWHGAGWNYVVWGGLHGSYLLANHTFRSKFSHAKIPPIVSWAVTIVAVMAAWIFFRAENMKHALAYLSEFFALQSGSTTKHWMLIFICSSWVFLEGWICEFRQTWRYAATVATMALVAVLSMGEETAFIYFNF